jgi:polyisoprenoid-binding protein YceI
MKKILMIIAFCNLAFGQLLNNQEPQLKIHKKSTSNISTKIDLKNFESRILLDKQKSKFSWKGGLKFSVSDHDGNLKMINGSIVIKDDVISGLVQINMKSITNNDLSAGSKERLVGHLKSSDFFYVSKYPTATLKIKSSKILGKLDNGKYKMLIDGDLTIKDKTNQISFEAIIDLDSNIKTAEGKLLFDRNKFGVQYRSEMHLDDPKSFWNKVQAPRNAIKDKVIRDMIEIDFNVVTLSEVISK